ncbi:MAG TPA: hypothetical protein VFF55_06080, partial [Candidatus Deferrimicrobium sp.]|nr:hypothetical protein [Candidatus Deferrimicrobium sp.]
MVKPRLAAFTTVETGSGEGISVSYKLWREGLLGFSELEARRSYARARNPLEGPLYAEAVSQQKAALTGKL